MDPIKLGSGDNEVAQTLPYKYVDQITSDDKADDEEAAKHENMQQGDENKQTDQNDITPQMIDSNEAKLKERIAQCRNIIESLKTELNEEKTKLENQNKSDLLDTSDLSTQNSKTFVSHIVETPTKCTTSHFVSSPSSLYNNLYTSGIYSECVDSKLSCDENLVEYEKQLQIYQNTLNMAQIEKKNAIRKQMLAKAYRLKLLEVENQCNIELLRVKQSLQCLEPLQLIASKWKTNTDTYDLNNYELIPRYPELNATSNCDMNICRGNKSPRENCVVSKDECILPD